jgi:hypothetical protein
MGHNPRVDLSPISIKKMKKMENFWRNRVSGKMEKNGKMEKEGGGVYGRYREMRGMGEKKRPKNRSWNGSA